MRFQKLYNIIHVILLLTVLIFFGCTSKDKIKSPQFIALDHKKTGIDFTNKLKPTPAFNMFNYMYFYNGAGVGAGDFNNDGKIDLFFSSNQGENKLYLNKGNMAFADVTKEATIPQDYGWSTGVSVIDINNDGLLDIYVCKVGKYETLNSKNQLLICRGINKDGVPFYEDRASQYGLDFSGFSTQAVFFDYDGDGDNDMFLLNHSVHQNGSFASRSNFLGTFSSLSGDRIFRNVGPAIDSLSQYKDFVFKDATASAGINSSAIGYGLGVVVSDINLDGYPDLYIGNDFHENDYLYINQQNGTFADENNQRLMHTSKFTMGVDAADINNDGFPEIISMDMLPEDPYILKRSLGEDEYDIFFDKIASGYNYQYSRNNLQYNRRNGLFSEVGLYAGVYATDWSWTPLWIDFDNDGLKDLFISNGIPKRLNDMDYVNFVSNRSSVQNLKLDETNMALIDEFPEIKIPNKFFKNEGELKFTDIADSISNDLPTYSNGAIYADLDNDGDLDIIVNNIDDPVLIYENRINHDGYSKPFIEIRLKGPEQNINATGAKIVVFEKNAVRTYENNPVRGFQSSMLIPVHIGLDNTKPDSVILIWPDNTYQNLSLADSNYLAYTYSKGLPKFDYKSILFFKKSTAQPVRDITSLTGITYKHIENPFNEFNREPLIPHLSSTEGPALAVGDANGDGLDDVFIGASKTFQSAIYIQQPGAKFIRLEQEALTRDSMYEDVDAIWADVNNDGYTDLVVASGGNEYYGADKHLLPRIYLNDGKEKFYKKEDAFENVLVTASCVSVFDFNKDGYPDMFVGGRAVPWEYGQTPKSYLLQNDGTGKFTDVTDKLAKGLASLGMVTDAEWVDLDRDGDKDLVVCCEWRGIDVFLNENGVFIKKELTEKKGWWNFLLPVDIDNDNDIDLVAGNLGLNSRLKASANEPVRLYYNDFDDNGKREQVLTYYINGKETVFANKDDLQKQLPFIKKKYLYAGDFAEASITEIFGADKLKEAQVLSADYFSNAILVNDGKMNFTVQAMPWEAQLTSYRDAVVVQANDDQQPDILLVGNYYGNNIQMGRYDADFGTMLVNKGNVKFIPENINGLAIKGQVRHIREILINQQKSYILARNNDSTMVINFSSK
jgi:enediyne biosynthesis protein E4